MIRDKRFTSIKSFPSRLFHHSVIVGFLLKKRWPPRSNLKLDHCTVRARPPTYFGSLSRTITSMPFCTSSQAAVSPAGPAPTTITLFLFMIRMLPSILGFQYQEPRKCAKHEYSENNRPERQPLRSLA